MGGDMMESLLYGAAIGIAVVVIFALIGMTRKANFSEPPRRVATLSTKLAPAEALARIKGLAGKGYSVVQEDPAKGMVVLQDSLSLLSFGNFYPIFARPGEVVVGISPKVPQYGPVVGSKLRKITDAVQGALGG
jgi:hypothetical protein